MYSDRVLRESVQRLEALRDQSQHANPVVTKDRLALHGVRDTHHQLQDAALLIASADGLEASPAAAVPAVADQSWQGQTRRLKEVSDAINAGLAPEVIKADFDVAKLREFGDDVGLRFGGEVEVLEGGLMEARFSRVPKDGDGVEFHVVLQANPADARVTAHTGLWTGRSQVLILGEPLPRDSALAALDAAVATFDDLKAKMPKIQASTQAEAKALADKVARSLDASVGEWSQTEAKDWVRSAATMPDGRRIRLSASNDGVVSVDGDAFTPGPGGERMLNVTEEAVAASMQVAFARAPLPAFPINTDRVFVDAPGDVGVAWGILCEEENRLAGYLCSLEEGTAVVSGEDAWYLEKGDDQRLVLMHGNVVDGKIEDPQSRFDSGLDWVDSDVEALRSYNLRVSSVADDFMIDRELWKTMKVEHGESPSMSM